MPTWAPRWKWPPESLPYLNDLYDAEIAQNDDAFGALVASLQEMDFYDDSLVIFLSDHGEEFQEHRGWRHGRRLYTESLSVPIIVTLTGEGGSGGALAIAVGNRVLMMEDSVYSVISPEGCAAILWKDGTKGEQAAEALKLTARDIDKLGCIIDDVIPEPVGGAHSDHKAAAEQVRSYLKKHLDELKQLSPEELKEQRYQKLRAMSFIEE